MILGYITSFTVITINGFATNLMDEQIEVSLFLNGNKMDTQIANMPTEYNGVFKTIGNHGFEFNLPKVIGTVHSNDNIEVRVLNRPLPFTARLAHLRYKALKQSKDRELFFFMHSPKTAGSSFRSMLDNQFDPKQVWPTIEQIADGGYPQIELIRNTKEILNPDLRLIVGHYPLKIIRFLPVRPRVITFLRKPEDHLTSLVKHQKRRHPKLKKMSFEEILTYHLPNDPQCRFFNPFRTNPDQAITPEIFSSIIWNLTSIEFICITERFDESIEYIESKTKWNLGAKIERNIHPTTEVITKKDRELLKSKTSWDRKLYDKAIEIFNKNVNGG